MKKVLGLLLVVCLAMFSIGCGSTGGGGGSAGFTVTINADQTSGNAPLTVHFSYTCNPSSTTVTACSWAFGNGDVSTEASPTYAYNSAGTFNATLTVTSNDGKTANASKSITVTTPVSTGTITGHVSDADTNGDIGNCHLSVSASAGGNKTDLITNGDGMFTATVSPGTYQISCPTLAISDGHSSPYVLQTKSATVTANQTTATDFSLLPTLQLISVAPYEWGAPYYHYWHAIVRVKYNGTSTTSSAQLLITAYDSNNIALGTETEYINDAGNLQPGQTYEKDAWTDFTYSRVARYTYTWETQDYGGGVNKK